MRNCGILLASLVFAAACSSAPPRQPPVLAAGAGVVGAGSAAIIAQAEAAEKAYTPADVEFMSGMVPHHAQAIVMAGWCLKDHGARADLVPLCQRIQFAQTGEIRMMRQWLADRGQVVPDSASTRHVMIMDGMRHEMMMPGMLTDEEMVALDAARGQQFDYLFLTGMIRHHQGAIQMVQELWAQPGAAAENTVFRFSNDVVSDQSAEINRMQLMLESIPR
jgi:uncharacterized protein (DUF305 family)